MSKPQPSAELASLCVCASHVGVPAKWLKERAIAGDIPCLRIGKRRLLFNIAAVKAALACMAAQIHHCTERKPNE